MSNKRKKREGLLNNVYNYGSTTDRLKLEPIYDKNGATITSYKVIDDSENIWMIGTRYECERYLGIED